MSENRFSSAAAEPGADTASDSDELWAWLRLATVPGLGRIAARRLLSAFGMPGQVLSADVWQLRQWVSPEQADAVLAPPDAERSGHIARAIEWARQPDHHLLTLADRAYPQRLLHLADPPLVVYAQGRLERLQAPALAIVGARNATLQGRRDAGRFAAALAEAGFAVVSGLADGIDGAAHAAALACGGSTIAVIGTGIDRVYPRGHRELAARIGAEGLLLTEFEPGTPARSHHFPQRNRVIAALSQGVLVVEAALRSGSLITARLAAELGRDVFAVPGSIHSALAHGCHRLIRDGAKLVEHPTDVLEEFGVLNPASVTPPTASAGPSCDDPLGAALAYDPVDIDALCAHAGLPAETVTAALLRLELAGLVERLPGNRYRRLA